QPDLADTEEAYDRGRQSVVAQVRRKAELHIRFHRVETVILQLVGTELVHQADAAAFLVFVDQQAAPTLDNLVERQFQLRAAIAAQAVQHIAGQTLRVYANQGRAQLGRQI